MDDPIPFWFFIELAGKPTHVPLPTNLPIILVIWSIIFDLFWAWAVWSLFLQITSVKSHS